MKIILGSVFSRRRPGSLWYRLQIGLGLQKLGHTVYFVEEPRWCVTADGKRCSYEHSIQRILFWDFMRQFGLTDHACQIYNNGTATAGISLTSLISIAKECDLLLNISGEIRSPAILNCVKRCAYLDDDPVYTQIWLANGEDLNIGSHHVFFTRGLNIGDASSQIPISGIRWHPVLPPVIRDLWDFNYNESSPRFTTIASWKPFTSFEYDGEIYGSKVDEFERYATLPKSVTQEFEIAVKQYQDQDEAFAKLKKNGWFLTPASQINTPECYQNYIGASRAEIGIVHNAYIKANSGWFSERSSHYLVSGKPVLVQSTGFEKWLPTGEGLLTFSNLEEAVSGVESINRDYERHCKRAREFAEEYLSYEKVLPAMLEICGSC